MLARSHLWRTRPIGGPIQPDFLNAAILVRSRGATALTLIERLLHIEVELGRVRPSPVRDGPRVIDLDVLWMEGVVSSDPRIILPHPRLHERAFALAPLLEVIPSAEDPRTARPLVLPMGMMESQNVQKLDELL